MKSSWSKVKLGEVLQPSDTAVPTTHIPTVNLAGVYSFGRGLFKRGPMSPGKTSYKSYNRLVVDDFVISQPKAWEGALARVTPAFDGWFLSPVFPTFRAERDRLDPSYLEWFCKREPVWVEIQRKSRGIGARRESVSPEQFLSLEIPLPPLAEQRRIVARIEDLAAKIEDARAVRQQAVEEGGALSRASAEEYYQRLRNRFAAISLAEVCDSITDGDHNTPTFTEQGVRFIFVGNVSSGRLHFNGCKHVTEAYFRTLKAQRLPERGDILYSAVGATLGVPAVVDRDEPFCFQRHVAILKPNRAALNSQFLWCMLRSRTVFEKAWSSTTGSAQPTVPLRAIRALTIPLPPIPEQCQIVAELDALQAKVDALKRAQAETAAELDALLPSILDRAFAGAL